MGKRARRRVREQHLHGLLLGTHGTGDKHGPIGEAWMLDGPLAEVAALYQADTPEGLQRVLLIPGRRTDTDCRDAVAAFRRAYDGDDTGLVGCVVLACTHHRWRGVARRLLEGLVEQGVLHAGQIGPLATAFLDADAVPVTAPGAWLVDFYVQERGGELRRLDPAKTYTLWRPVGPQLRRWAVRETVRDRDDVGPVLTRARTLDSRHAAAVALGLLDAANQLDAESAAEVVDIGLDWPDPSVRLTALKRLAAAGRDAEALERAEGDGAARIRRWAATHRQRTLLNDRGEPTADASRGSDAPTVEPSCPQAVQPALFG